VARLWPTRHPPVQTCPACLPQGTATCSKARGGCQFFFRDAARRLARSDRLSCHPGESRDLLATGPESPKSAGANRSCTSPQAPRPVPECGVEASAFSCKVARHRAGAPFPPCHPGESRDPPEGPKPSASGGADLLCTSPAGRCDPTQSKGRFRFFFRQRRTSPPSSTPADLSFRRKPGPPRQKTRASGVRRCEPALQPAAGFSDRFPSAGVDASAFSREDAARRPRPPLPDLSSRRKPGSPRDRTSDPGIRRCGAALHVSPHGAATRCKALRGCLCFLPQRRTSPCASAPS